MRFQGITFSTCPWNMTGHVFVVQQTNRKLQTRHTGPPRYWQNVHHSCSLSSPKKRYFYMIKKQNVWAKPRNPSVVSTDKIPLSKLPLGVRQDTLRFRKDTEEIKLKNTVVTLLRTEAIDTVLILYCSIHFVKTQREPFCRALLQIMRSGWFCYFKCFISEYLSKYDSSFFTDRTKRQIQKQKEKLWCSSTESTWFVPCNWDSSSVYCSEVKKKKRGKRKGEQQKSEKGNFLMAKLQPHQILPKSFIIKD